MEDNIIDISKNMPHRVSEVMCVKCYERWVAVRHEDVLLKNMECVTCGTGFIIETGQTIKEGGG